MSALEPPAPRPRWQPLTLLPDVATAQALGCPPSESRPSAVRLHLPANRAGLPRSPPSQPGNRVKGLAHRRPAGFDSPRRFFAICRPRLPARGVSARACRAHRSAHYSAHRVTVSRRLSPRAADATLLCCTSVETGSRQGSVQLAAAPWRWPAEADPGRSSGCGAGPVHVPGPAVSNGPGRSTTRPDFSSSNSEQWPLHHPPASRPINAGGGGSGGGTNAGRVGGAGRRWGGRAG